MSFRRRRRSPSRSPEASTSYSSPQYKKSRDGYYECRPCNVKVDRWSIFDIHLHSKNHLRRTAPLSNFKCDICDIKASSAETLDSHMKGKKHLDRAALFARRREGRRMELNQEEYDVAVSRGQRQLQKLMEEVADLSKRWRILNKAHLECILNHRERDADFEDDIAVESDNDSP